MHRCNQYSSESEQFTSIDEKEIDPFMLGKVTKCTLEDFELTYWKLKQLGPEEVKTRLNALRELQTAVKEMKHRVREVDAVFPDGKKNSFDLQGKRNSNEFLSLPCIFPAVCKVDKIAGYKGVLSTNEQVKTHPDQVKTRSGKARKKNFRRMADNGGSLCINCQLETMNDTVWLPPLNGSKTAGNISRKGTKKEKIVLPELKLTKYS